MTKWYWPRSNRCWTVSLTWRLKFGYYVTPFVRALAVGPLTIALCDLTWQGWRKHYPED